jgi:glyoxylase-like metal-dependent hydrolase (beta-lactamase superfamily II)
MNGDHAWNVAGQNAIPAGADRDQRTAVEARQAQIWLTPHGFIKAAMTSHNATARAMTVRGARKSVIVFTAPSGVQFKGMLDEQNLIERIETWIHSPVLGNTMLEAVFSDYKDFGDVKYPARIIQREGGYPVLDITVTDVKRNVAVAIEVPAGIRQARSPAPAAVELEKLEDGIWVVPGGAKSIAVEFRDHIVVIEAPASEARSIAVIDALVKAIPDKPIRYVINTHAHFDHAGGLRTYAAEGATVITWAGNIPYFEQVWANPRTINPDRLAQSGRRAVFEGVVGSRVLSDDSRSLVIYHYGAGNPHDPGMMMVFLTEESILIEADSFSPAANPHQAVSAGSGLVHFHESVERLRLGIRQIIPIHGPLVTTLDDLRKAVEVFKNMSGTD